MERNAQEMAKIKSRFKSFKSSKDAKKNIVFLPYKASMWDSLESIWQAAFEDKEYCNTYVIPIPYADLTPDRKVAKWHCEIDLFPKDVPVLDYKKVNLKKLKPDVIFIHNPYDNYNLVTSVDSTYYSSNLKPLTKLLIYVPYYATTGLMSEGQRYMPSYDNSDYIIIQSEALRPFFDSSIPAEKLQPFGSPKFDRVIQMCKTPPEVPEEWKEKIHGRKVYFYNTSLGGLLQNTEKFFLKMRYVFETFAGRKDACLLWRPHPLIQATLGSMRQEAQTVYNQLKDYFIKNDIGIYDDTPDIDKSIAISDIYIGDTGTSVTSLFGVAGKPSFFLNNNINALPTENDRKNVLTRLFHPDGKEWIVTQGNKLYYAPNHDYNYHYYCDLSDHIAGNYYKHVLEIDGKVFVFPCYAQDILIIGDHKVERRISLKKIQNDNHRHLFSEVIYIGDYVFVVPNYYPYLIRFNIKTEEVKYISGFNDFFIQPNPSNFYRDSYGIWNGNLLLASPNTRSVLIVNIETSEMQQINLPSKRPAKGGFLSMIPDGETFWLLPYVGKNIARLNMEDGTVTEYSDIPQGFQCRMIPQGMTCDERPFSSAVCDEDEVFLVPFWGNMFVRLDKKTGHMQEWKTPFTISYKIKNGYFSYDMTGIFKYLPDKNEIFFFHSPERQYYKFDLKSKTFTKFDMNFDIEELFQHSDGFKSRSEWEPYGCYENAFQTLKALLDNELPGKKFDIEAQIETYKKFNASMDGKAGEKIYQFAKQKLEEKRKS